MRITKLGAVIAASALGLSMAACGGDPTTDNSTPAASTIVVGSSASPESQIIAEMYYQALKAGGIKVGKKLSIGAREAYVPALKDGSIDLIPDYTGNLLSYFDKNATATTAADVESALGSATPSPLKVLAASPAADADSINVTPEFAAKHSLKSIGDLKGIAGLKVAANPEFAERAYGIPGLKKFYGVTATLKPINDYGGPLTLKALLDGDVQLADIYSTTPSITEHKLVTLEDPQHMIAAQNVIPLINGKKATAKVTSILNKVSSQLTTADLLDLNGQNQGPDKAEPAALAKKWLTAMGLL